MMNRTENNIGETQAVSTLIINADDWGARQPATDRILDCLRSEAISSTSALVFMDDSERAAELAREYHVDAGLHLNLTDACNGPRVPSGLARHLEKTSRFLRRSRYAGMFFHPLLVTSFDYVVKAQVEEYERLYGARPNRVDGHRHMHLCANVLGQKLLDRGVIVRRNFTFTANEKSALNRLYRRLQDRALARRYRIPDYFCDLLPMEEARLRDILRLGEIADVEMEVHPERTRQYEFLMQRRLQELGRVIIARGYQLRGKAEAIFREPIAARPEPVLAPEIVTPGRAAREEIPHISVCICTYKRPEPLKRLLGNLNRQRTGGKFTFSVVIADNDEERSGEGAVEAMQAEMRVPVKYCVETQRGIARARNRVLANSAGEYVALIDDDEFPVEDWLLQLFAACQRYGVDGVLGPVRRHFDTAPPAWLKRSRLYDRAVNPTGMRVVWRGARTGNVLMKRDVFLRDEAPFDVEFKAGEDQDFFRRKIEEGRRFVWSAEAVAYEVLPPARWKRSYYVRKALLHGGYSAMQPDCGAVSVIKSLIAVPLYTLGLPFALLGGQHRFMTLLVKLCDHAGKLLFLAGIRPIREEYVSD